MQAPVYNLAGEVVDNIEINDMVFATPFNEDLVHQAALRQQANARQGTASTLTRGDVSGSSKKLYRQKGPQCPLRQYQIANAAGWRCGLRAPSQRLPPGNA